ncbi:interleukin-8-like isoform X2 [Hyperolius riggenbachi]|uniref:interleukin-8-like isoform X2 n=1 Tax=Hyperolius riggenbachi TaxID=752182 RepID=UPI0035A36B6F
MEGMSIQRSTTDLRCQCIKLETKQISKSVMDSVELIPSGPHCKNLEVIITLKTGGQVCVDPSAPWVDRIVKILLERQKNEQESS